jgi:histone H3/H4
MSSPEQTSTSANTFRLCSSCKTPIPFEASYYRCSVSTCNRARVAYYFCSVPCWDAHVPEQRHRDAWAEPAKAPTRAADAAERAREAPSASAEPAQRRIVDSKVVAKVDAATEKEILVVVSKLKGYIKAKSGFSTSDEVMEALSVHLRRLADRAIESAEADGRKTVMKRDLRLLVER